MISSATAGRASRNEAAFFDIDGTILPQPSLESCFVRFLRWRGELRARHYLYWLGQALRLAPHGIFAVRHGNKMYLRGLPTHGSGGAPLIMSARFFAEAFKRIAWHVSEGHGIVLVSGTLEPLAEILARVLEAQVAAQGCPASVRVAATQLETSDGRWTGNILGEPMAGEAKARAAHRLAEEYGYDLSTSYAYGDSTSDRWLLGAVGHPVAVNPSRRLARVARAAGWPVVHWKNV